MNKFYHVIWSKVNHQHVTVLKSARQDRKKPSTAGRSAKAMVTALALCGASLFSGYGMQPAYADGENTLISTLASGGAETSAGQYIAITITDTETHTDGDTTTFTDNAGVNHTYVYKEFEAENGKSYSFWVREGYTIAITDTEESERFEGAGSGLVISVINIADGADTDGILQSYQTVDDTDALATTVNGDELVSNTTGAYGAAVNSKTTAVGGPAQEFILSTSKDVEPIVVSAKTNIDEYFTTELDYNELTGQYSYNGEVISRGDLYVLNGDVGVFVVDDKVWTGNVYGRNNEILMTTVDSEGNLVSYWGAELIDENTTLADMTVGQLNEKFKDVWDNDEKLAAADIEQIDITTAANEAGEAVGGTIGLVTQGGTTVDSVAVSRTGGTNGDDVVITFSNPDEEGQSFSIATGSLVDAVTTSEESKELTGLTINGQEYTIDTGSWNLTTASDSDAVTVGNGTTVDFSGKTKTVGEGNEETETSNIAVSKETDEDGSVNVLFDLNDDLYLSGEDGSVTISGTNGTISVSNDSGSTTINGGTITVSSDNSISAVMDMYGFGITNSSGDGIVKYYITASGLDANGQTISHVAAGKDDTDAVNVSQLRKEISEAISSISINAEAADSDQHLVANPDSEDGNYSVVNNTVELQVQDGSDEEGNAVYTPVTIDNIAQADDLGNVDELHDDLKNTDDDGSYTDTSVVDAVNNLDDKVGDGDFSETTYAGEKDENGTYAETSVTEAIINLDDAIGNLTADVESAKTEAGKHTTVSVGNGLELDSTPATDTAGVNYEISIADDLYLGGENTEDSNTIAIKGSEGTISVANDNGSTVIVGGTVSADTSLTVGTGDNTVFISGGNVTARGSISAGQTTISDAGVAVGGNTYITSSGINANSQKIMNVDAGEISETSTDAVNGSQLYQTNLVVANNTQNIEMLSHSVSKLDNRIDRVGAGAAALAALHPLDFDPDAKWDFAAGYGNYRGANAVAVGAYYRPNEDLMFSVGGSMGGGENMVNAGISVKIGAGSSHVSTSRVAMAKEIKAMRDIIDKQDAQIQKLTAMVNALVGIQSESNTAMFPDVPENHWAYEAVAAMAKNGLVKGYPDGEFKGDRTMTRYEFAQIVYNAIQAGAEVDGRLIQEFKSELEYFRIDTVSQDKKGNPTIQRVRVNK